MSTDTVTDIKAVRKNRQNNKTLSQGFVAQTTEISEFDKFKRALAGAESGGMNIQNKSGSTASGKYQFLKSTFEGYAKDKNSPVYGMAWEDYKQSGDAQERLMDYALNKYINVLDANGLPVTNETLYMAHHFGPGRAVEILKGYQRNPNAMMKDFFPATSKPGDPSWDLIKQQNPWIKDSLTVSGAISQLGGKLYDQARKQGFVNQSNILPNAGLERRYPGAESEGKEGMTGEYLQTFMAEYETRREEGYRKLEAKRKAEEGTPKEESSKAQGFVSPLAGLVSPGQIKTFMGGFDIESLKNNIKEDAALLANMVKIKESTSDSGSNVINNFNIQGGGGSGYVSPTTTSPQPGMVRSHDAYFSFHAATNRFNMQ